MAKVSKNFSRSEFACKCGCGFDTVDAETIEVLERIRTHFAAPVVITSGCRCPSYNAQVGGSTKSQHQLGRAADIQVRGISPSEVQDWLEYNLPTVSLGRYTNFTHVDTRTNGPARWEGA